MISRRQEGGDEAYFTYVEEADNDANKNSALIWKWYKEKIMITLIATLKVKDGKMEEAINVLKEIVPKVKASEPGCLEYIPHTVRGDEKTIIFYEKYNDKDALKLHSANLMKNMETLFPLLEPGMDVKTCSEIVI